MISAVVISKSLPAKVDKTVTVPVRKELIATAIVTEKTNRASWRVDLKHSGRALGSLIGGGTSCFDWAVSAISMSAHSDKFSRENWN